MRREHPHHPARSAAPGLSYWARRRKIRSGDPSPAASCAENGQAHLAELRAAAGPGPVLIVTHDNPDPDALASGVALASLLEVAWHISSRLHYTGLIGRAENRAMLSHLTQAWEHVDGLSGLEDYSAVAMVDTQPAAGNNSLPSGVVPQIVIDHHHPFRDALGAARYADVQPEAAATVSLVYQYLKAAGIRPDPDLATAMFYGLHTDTCGLSRDASPADEAIYVELLAGLDRAKLIQVQQARLSQAYFDALSRGLQAARIYGQSVVADLGEMHRPDMMAEMADLLIRLEHTRAALCLGRFGGRLYVSLRTVSLGRDAGLLIQEFMRPFGNAGGHGQTAGGQVQLNGREPTSLVAEIEQCFLAVMGDAEQDRCPLAGDALAHGAM